jgi:prevent-host-death family protein
MNTNIKVYKVYEAKQGLSKILLELQQNGHEVVITKHGTPIARIIKMTAWNDESE